jgi:hypothetical protein
VASWHKADDQVTDGKLCIALVDDETFTATHEGGAGSGGTVCQVKWPSPSARGDTYPAGMIPMFMRDDYRRDLVR